MKRTIPIKIVSTILFVFIVCLTIKAQSIYSQESIKRIIDKVNTYQLNNPWAEYDDNWIRGTYYAGVMACYFATGDVKYLNQSEDVCESLNWTLPAVPPAPFSSGCNLLTMGQTMIQCYMVRPEKYKIRSIIDHLENPNLVKNALSNPDKWYWEGGKRYVDGLFTGPPALAMLYSVTDNEKYLQWMEAHFWDIYGKLYDPAEDLFFRDKTMFPEKLEERKNDPNWKGNNQVTAAGKKVLWSRGNGWAIAGIVRILEYLPMEHGSYKRYELLLQRMAKSLKERQSEEGFWYPNLADPDHPRVKETSGTGFLTYGIAYGINNRILDRDEYIPVVKKAWKSLTDAVSIDGKVQWGQIVGDRPVNVSKEDSHEYVTGTFLLAASEMYKMNLDVPKAKKRMDLAIVRKDIMQYIENELRGTNKPYGYYRQYPADGEKYGLYGSLDISLIRTIMGEDFNSSLTNKQRKEWIDHILSFSNEDGSYESTWHNTTHRNGMVISALGPLGGKQKYITKFYEDFNTVEKLTTYLDNEIAWDELWAGSLQLWGGIIPYSLSKQTTQKWKKAAFKYLNENLDPNTGWWKKGIKHTSTFEPVGGGAHIWPIYQLHNELFPYPQKVIDGILAFQLEDRTWYGAKENLRDGAYLDLDNLYGYAYMGSLAPKYKEKEIRESVKKYGDYFLEYFYPDFYTSKPNGHKLLALVSIAGLLQELDPDRFYDSQNKDWTDIFSDPSLYMVKETECLSDKCKK